MDGASRSIARPDQTPSFANQNSAFREMDFGGDHYYKLNRILLSAIGLWPHDHIMLRQIQVATSSFILLSMTFPQLIKLITARYDVDLVLRVLSTALPFMLFTAKYISFYFITEKIKELMQHIRNDWEAIKDNYEFKIIHRYAKAARLFTTSIAMTIYICAIMVLYIQYMPNHFNIAVKQTTSSNKSRRGELLFQTEYFLDQEQYYRMIQFHMSIGLMFALTTVLATESFCLAVSIHAYGMFKIAKYTYRTSRIIDTNMPNASVGKDRVSYDNMVNAVNGHRKAIEFSELIKTTFATSYLALILLGVTSSSVNLFLLFQALMSTSSMNDLLRSIVYVIWHFIYMFLTNYAGQKYIDYDFEVYREICSLRWYSAPLRMQKQILFMMQKTIKSYHIDVGGLYNPSLEGFTKLASASLSYFTVLYSMRKQ